MALGGVTVVLQGPQGEDATLTDDKGVYNFTSLPVGLYVIRFYVANAAAGVEQGGVIDRRRQDGPRQRPDRGRRPGAGPGEVRHHRQAAGRRHRQRARRRELRQRVHGERPAGPHLRRRHRARPGRLRRPQRQRLDRRCDRPREHLHRQRRQRHRHRVRQPRGGNAVASAAAPTCRWNSSRRSTSAAAATRRRCGGGMGGVVNSILKSGTNEFHGSAFGYWAPYWASASPNSITTVGGSLGYVRKPDFDSSIGVEVGGPIIKDKLFFWAGFSPRFQDTHVFRQTYQLQYNGDATIPGPALDMNGNPISRELPTGAPASPSHTRRTTTPRRSTGFPAPSTTCRSPRSAAPTSTTRCARSTASSSSPNPAWARGEADQVELGLHRALDVEAVRSPLADRRPARRAHRILLRALAEPGAQQPQPAGVLGCQPVTAEHAPGCEHVATHGATSSSRPAPSTTTTRVASARTRRPAAPAGWPTSSRPTSSMRAATTRSRGAGTPST